MTFLFDETSGKYILYKWEQVQNEARKKLFQPSNQPHYDSIRRV